MEQGKLITFSVWSWSWSGQSAYWNLDMDHAIFMVRAWASFSYLHVVSVSKHCSLDDGRNDDNSSNRWSCNSCNTMTFSADQSQKRRCAAVKTRNSGLGLIIITIATRLMKQTKSINLELRRADNQSYWIMHRAHGRQLWFPYYVYIIAYAKWRNVFTFIVGKFVCLSVCLSDC